MEIIQENSTLILVVLLVLSVIGAGFFLIPFLKRKGYLKQDDVQNTAQLLEIIKALSSNIKYNKNENKKIVKTVFEISEIAVRFVEQSMAYNDNLKKKLAAQQTVLDILNQLNVEVDEDMKNLIEVGIESAVNQLPKTYN